MADQSTKSQCCHHACRAVLNVRSTVLVSDAPMLLLIHTQARTECPKEAPSTASPSCWGWLHSAEHRNPDSLAVCRASGGQSARPRKNQAAAAARYSNKRCVQSHLGRTRERSLASTLRPRARWRRTERLLHSSDENEQRRNRLANRLIEPCDLTRVQSPKHVREEQPEPADDQHGRRIVVVARILSETSQ